MSAGPRLREILTHRRRIAHPAAAAPERGFAGPADASGRPPQ
jgi:hypothetical protein